MPDDDVLVLERVAQPRVPGRLRLLEEEEPSRRAHRGRRRPRELASCSVSLRITSDAKASRSSSEPSFSKTKSARASFSSSGISRPSAVGDRAPCAPLARPGTQSRRRPCRTASRRRPRRGAEPRSRTPSGGSSSSAELLAPAQVGGDDGRMQELFEPLRAPPAREDAARRRAPRSISPSAPSTSSPSRSTIGPLHVRDPRAAAGGTMSSLEMTAAPWRANACSKLALPGADRPRDRDGDGARSSRPARRPRLARTARARARRPASWSSSATASARLPRPERRPRARLPRMPSASVSAESSGWVELGRFFGAGPPRQSRDPPRRLPPRGRATRRTRSSALVALLEPLQREREAPALGVHLDDLGLDGVALRRRSRADSRRGAAQARRCARAPRRPGGSRRRPRT